MLAVYHSEVTCGPPESPTYSTRMRVAVLADIHGNLPALEAVLREVDAAGAEAVVLAGEMTVGPLQAETLDTKALEIFSDWARQRRSH